MVGSINILENFESFLESFQHSLSKEVPIKAMFGPSLASHSLIHEKSIKTEPYNTET